MFSNYLKTAWRTIVRNKAFSAINILGLASGLACSLLILLWVQDERSVDAFHKNGKQLYQVYERSLFDGKVEAGYPTQGLLAEELKRVIPEIEQTSGYEYAAAPGTQNTFEARAKVIKMNGMFAGADFLTMFTFPVLQGDAATALHQPQSIAISQKMADYFFGSTTKALGQTIRFDNKEDLQVTAVFENVPEHSSLQFDFLRSWSDFVKQNDWVHNWGNTSPATFIALRKDANPILVQSKIKDFIYRYQQKPPGLRTELDLQPFTQRYLYSNFKNGYIDGGRIDYVRLFVIIAVFILLIACINFMNLATAHATKRAKEVGVRKVVGAAQPALMAQFIGEALLVTFLAILVALGLCQLALPSFNALTGKHLVLPFDQFILWKLIASLLLFTGLVAGSYPAFFLSSLQPIRVLKGTLKVSGPAIFFRKGLVIFQFALSIILISGTIMIYRQMEYVQHKNLGYNRDNLVYIPIEGELVDKYNLFKQEANNLAGVLDVSKMRNAPTDIEHHTNSIDWRGKDPNANISFADGVVGYDFAKTLGARMVEGRDFSNAFADSASYILNETAARKIGFANPVGQRISWGNRQGTVIGVLQDFHFNSLHRSIDPLILRLDENWGWGTILVRIKAGETKTSLQALETICKALNPKFPFTYQFADLEYAKQYKSEQVVSQLSGLFAFLSIFIASLGLFGLAMFMAAQRRKELGIRKVLGASAKNIVMLLSGNFLRLVCIAFLVAFPVAWYTINRWLQDFAYRVSIPWWVFVSAGTVAVLIAAITISFQAIKAAVANPVKSLRTE